MARKALGYFLIKLDASGNSPVPAIGTIPSVERPGSRGYGLKARDFKQEEAYGKNLEPLVKSLESDEQVLEARSFRQWLGSKGLALVARVW